VSIAPISSHVYHRRVQFPETDASGIVHFTNFFKYVEEAEHSMWRAAGLSIAGRNPEIGWPRVAASFEYRKPLRFEDEFDVHISIAEKTKKTIRYSAELKKAGELMARGSLTIICVRRQPGQPTRARDIPAEIDARFAVDASVAAITE
jgi:YbgC/YbaW family acyl-CoA thioester hydrolase